LGGHRGEALAGEDASHRFCGGPDRLEPHDGPQCGQSGPEQNQIYRAHQASLDDNYKHATDKKKTRKKQ